MKKLFIAALLLAVTIQTSFAQRIKGSDTVLPLAQKESESYLKKNPSSKITVTGGGSGVCLSSLVYFTTDIAMASRKMKFEERSKLRDAGKAPQEVTIAYDALSVIVHPANKVSKLTREQLESIFTGKITNWKQVGGEDLKIIVYSRETSSGTYEFFKEHVLNNKNYASSILSMPATGAIIQSVSQTKGAIGYVGLAYLTKSVKSIDISYDGGKTYYEPTFQNAKSKKYPVVRPLYFYHIKGNKVVQPFIDYVLSAEGQKLVQETGYIPVK